MILKEALIMAVLASMTLCVALADSKSEASDLSPTESVHYAYDRHYGYGPHVPIPYNHHYGHGYAHKYGYHHNEPHYDHGHAHGKINYFHFSGYYM